MAADVNEMVSSVSSSLKKAAAPVKDAASSGQSLPGKILSAVKKVASPIATGLKNESKANKELHAEGLAAVKRMRDKDKGLAKALDKAYGFAVFPSVGRASLVLGIAFGKGEVFTKGSLAGYSGLVQLTLGVQVGGETYSELVLFQDKNAYAQFKRGKVGFAANASAVLVKAGAAAANNYKNGMQVYVQPEGGLLLQVDIGGQKMIFRPAALSRGMSADEEPWGPPPGGAEEKAAETEKRRTPARTRRPEKPQRKATAPHARRTGHARKKASAKAGPPARKARARKKAPARPATRSPRSRRAGSSTRSKRAKKSA